MKRILKAFVLFIIISLMIGTQVKATDENERNIETSEKITINDIYDKWKKYDDDELSLIIGDSETVDIGRF